MLNPFKTYIYAGAAAIILVLAGYCYMLKSDNRALTAERDAISLIAEQKQNAAKQCSDSVDNLKKEQDKITKEAQDALQQAKKEADEWEKKAQATLGKTPKEPVITDKNKNQFGGSDKEKALKDYYSTHQLANEDIDERNVK